MKLGLKGKVVVITGGGSGIGKAAAFEFAHEEAVVIITGRNEEKLDKAQKEASDLGFCIYREVFDVRNQAETENMADKIVSEFGRIDCWVNNAGLAINKPFDKFTTEDFNAVMETNLNGVFYGTKAAASHMKKQGSGVILNASSYAVRIPHAGGALYAAAKSGVSSFTKTFAAELAPYGIRVIGYIPGMIVTEIAKETIKEREGELVKATALQRLGTPEDLAKPIVFFASDACAYMTGVDVEITGGKYCVQNSDYAWNLKGAKKDV